MESLIDEITVDAQDVDEQLMAFLQVFLDEVALPAPATLLDIAVEVTGFDSEGDERRGLVATADTQTVPARCRSPTSVSIRSRSRAGFTLLTGPGWVCHRSLLGVPRTGAGHLDGTEASADPGSRQSRRP